MNTTIQPSAPARTRRRVISPLLGAALIAGTLLGERELVAQGRPTTHAVRGRIVHTMEGEPIPNGMVVFSGSRITYVGPAAGTSVPDGVQVWDAAVVTPGLIDAHTTVGLSGQFNQAHDQDQLDPGAPLQPELRAIDAYNPRERLVDWVRSLGVTTVNTGHGPGAVISGQTMLVKTWPPVLEDALLDAEAMLAVTLGPGATTSENGKSPGTRAKAVAMLRSELVRAQAYRAKRDADEAPDRDLQLETLSAVLDGDLPLLVTVHRYHDILAALRLADEFRVKLVLDGAAEAYLVADAIAAADVPVIVHPAMARSGGLWDQAETINISMETAGLLADAGVRIALQSGFESYVPKTRVLLFEAGVAAAHGLGTQRALAAITIDAARILGAADRIGSLAVGKDADIALWDGDPFEYTSHCTGVFVNGERASDIVR